MKLFTLLGILVLTNSCAYHSGMIVSTTVNSGPSNLTYVDMAAGYSKASYFLGLGGLNKDALVNDAKRNLYSSYPLKSGESFDNLTLDVKKTIIGPYSKIETIVIADVVKRDSNFRISYQPGYSTWLNRKKMNGKNDLVQNEKILISVRNFSYSQARIISLNMNSATVFFMDENGSVKVKNILYNSIYKTEHLDSLESKTKLKIGSKVRISARDNTGLYKNFNGTVIGMNKDDAMVETSPGYVNRIPYGRIEKL